MTIKKLIIIGLMLNILAVNAETQFKVDLGTGQMIKVNNDNGRIQTLNLETGEMGRGYNTGSGTTNIYTGDGVQRINLDSDGNVNNIYSYGDDE